MTTQKHVFYGAEGRYVAEVDFDRVTTERDALQQRLNAVEEENDRLAMICRSRQASIEELEVKVEKLRGMLPDCGNCGGCGQVDDGYASFDCWVCDGVGAKLENRS